METPANFRTRAQAQEAELLAAMQTATQLIAPPFTPKVRARIREAFSHIHNLYGRLNETWLRQLHLPQSAVGPYYGAEQVYFNALRRRLNLTLELHGLLQQVLTAKLLPVMPDTTPGATALGRQLYAYEGALYHIHDYLSPPRPKPEDHIGKHNDIPLPFTLFSRLIQLARRTALAVGHESPLSFLDVGCGVGLKVLQAAQVFEIVQGLEYDNTRVVVADQLIQRPRRPEDKVFQADALTYNGYAGFDVIYAYKPLSLSDLLIQMETRIIEHAKPGTVLVLPYSEFEDRYKDFGCGRVDSMVYVTGFADRDMKPLLRKIAQIGFIVPNDSTLRNFDEGFVAPLANALRHWGHLA